MVEQLTFQLENGGSHPTSPLQSFRLKEISNLTALCFCKRWHYSKTCPACFYNFGLYVGGELAGIASFGEPAMKNQRKCYDAKLELRRLCLIDDTPRNAESYFIGKCLWKLKNLGFRGRIISLADPEHGHTGIIYKASNFKYLGLEKGGGSREIVIDGVILHSRTVFQKYGASGIDKLKQLLPGHKIEIREKKRKFVYGYEI